MNETDDEIYKRIVKGDLPFMVNKETALKLMVEARKSEQKLWKEAQEIWKNEVKVERLKANCDPEKHGKIKYEKLTPCGCYEAEIFHRDELLKLAEQRVAEEIFKDLDNEHHRLANGSRVFLLNEWEEFKRKYGVK